MDLSYILSRCDHTLLNQKAGWDEIKEVCDDARRFGCASACIPPAFVGRAAEYTAGAIAICTVIGFPNGYSATAVKVFEARDAVLSGAAEIDMVINLGRVKDAEWDALTDEIRAVKDVCGKRVLKVIVETCLLTEAEKVRLCRIVSESGADYIKTSTGFSSAGAAREDIALFARTLPRHVKIKASGGIRTLADARGFLELGAHRLGASSLVALAKSGAAEQPRLL